MTTQVEAFARRATARDWCPEADTRDSIVARRNALAGLWAGRLMRMPDDTLTIYAAEVHASGSMTGSDAIVQKLWYDLNRAGVPMSRDAVASKIGELHRDAIGQLSSTD
ncbi:ATPase inhibitor subunit zeta [Rhodoplanes roseus]|nr:ATPase inhibitor subunit zeta [Rhodoplanes roseus]